MYPEEGSTQATAGTAASFAIGKPQARAIPDHADAIATKAKELHQVCDELRQRLGPILGPEGPEAEELKAVLPEVSPVAAQLIDLHGVLHSLERRLRDILSRVEL